MKHRLALFTVVCSFAGSSAAEPLHAQIDRAIESATPSFATHAATPAEDGEFLRRITLDLTGTIPTVEEARTFLKDRSSTKRQAAVDRLLSSAAYARHFANVFDVMLMERRVASNVPEQQWREYLRASLAANKPWDQLAREILVADGTEAANRPAARFFLDRDAEPHLLTRDISRIFLGMNLQCAQCHDHPKIEDYTQEDYYGLFAFLSRTVLSRNRTKKLAILTEKADGDVTFVSVFDPAKKTKSSGPHMPDLPTLREPPALKGKPIALRLAIGARPLPTYSRRALLAPKLTDPANVYFRRNIANRLWAHMMGRGLYHPLDLDHPANPPSHPELLTLLADDLAAHKFDIRYLLRELALTRTYQRSSESRTDPEKVDPAQFAVAILKPLNPEQFAWSLMQGTGLVDATRLSLGKKATDDALAKSLEKNVASFVRIYGSGAGLPQTFDARADQALFLSNGTQVRGWLSPRKGNLTGRLVALKDAGAIAEELYLSVFTRLPSAEERKEVADFLKDQQDRPVALQDLAWGLLASAEFRFNH